MHARGPFRFSAFILGAVLCGASVAAAAMSPASSPTSGKALVLDGHVVHDVGDLWSHQSNWGLIGSMPTAGGSYSDAPSAMWPARSGVEYLWAAGLWVGARDGAGVPHVSTAGYFSEFRPTAAAGDTIHQTFQGAPGGNRYPFADPDDDGDGREDEDPLNGLDDDGDGLVDEDFAAVGDQHFASRYGDVHDSLHLLPDHVPLGLTIRQQSFQWAALANGRVIGFEFTIT
ncbi:hypothetical protein KDM41_02560, partial [bacterium]|nr:hypothetical protein [bacterium]